MWKYKKEPIPVDQKRTVYEGAHESFLIQLLMADWYGDSSKLHSACYIYTGKEYLLIIGNSLLWRSYFFDRIDTRGSVDKLMHTTFQILITQSYKWFIMEWRT